MGHLLPNDMVEPVMHIAVLHKLSNTIPLYMSARRHLFML